MYPSGTPLSNIPERAIHAQPFQPPTSNFYPAYVPSNYYYSGQPAQYGAMPSFVPHTASMDYALPEAPMASDPQQGTMAHESNGMTYYTQVAQMQYAPHEAYLQAQSYAVPGMGGMMTPSPEGAYYYQNNGPMFYPQAQWAFCFFFVDDIPRGALAWIAVFLARDLLLPYGYDLLYGK
jgi:hypothetical protein